MTNQIQFDSDEKVLTKLIANVISYRTNLIRIILNCYRIVSATLLYQQLFIIDSEATLYIYLLYCLLLG